MAEMNYKKFLNQLVKFEGLRTKAYRDQVGIPTIGVGTIRYPDGTPVKMGDTCTEAQAYQWAETEAGHMLAKIKPLVKVQLNEAQWIALLCLAYNIGTGGLSNSSVLKAINAGKPLAEIERFWKLWNKGTVNGVKVELKGLTIRRNTEFKIYSGKLAV